MSSSLLSQFNVRRNSLIVTPMAGFSATTGNGVMLNNLSSRKIVRVEIRSLLGTVPVYTK